MKPILRAVTALLVPTACGSPAPREAPSSGTAASARSEVSRPVALAGSDCLRLDPDSMVLSGTLESVERFGPPAFGERPVGNERLSVPVLRAHDAFEVCPAPQQIDPVPPLPEIQLGFEAASGIPTELYGQKISVPGRLIPAVSGYHFTPVVLMVSGAKPK